MEFVVIFLGFSIMMAAAIFISVRLYQVRPDFVVKVLKYGLIVVFCLGYGLAALAIGERIDRRHTSSYSRSLKSVQQIWGGELRQAPPSFAWPEQVTVQKGDPKTGKTWQEKQTIYRDSNFALQDISVRINKNIRQKGLLQFPGYDMEFQGKFIVRNQFSDNRRFRFSFPLAVSPVSGKSAALNNITGLGVLLNGKTFQADTNYADGVQHTDVLAPGEEQVWQIRYRSKGTESFQYLLGQRQIQIKHLKAKLVTDFDETRLPTEGMVPATSASASKDGLNLTEMTWSGHNLITGQNIGLEFKISGNYGELAARLFRYAPLAMFLFLGLILILTVARTIRLHPMHYLFMLGGFFVFYLLGSYLLSYMSVVPAILSALTVSTVAMVYYSHAIDVDRGLWPLVLSAALIFQWVFSLAFFLPEHTGLIITVAAVVAFFALMKMTAKIDWSSKW